MWCRPPHYVDYKSSFTARSDTYRCVRNCSYMNGPSDPGVHILRPDGTWARHYAPGHGQRASVAPASMVELPLSQDSPGWQDTWSDLRFDPRYPLFFGRLDEMVLVYMFDRALGDSFIPFMSPTGGDHNGVSEFDRHNPAWDWRFCLRDLVPGDEVVIRCRLSYKRFISEQDILDEFESFWTELQGA